MTTLIMTIDNLTVRHGYFDRSRPPDVDGIKIFDEGDQATKQFLWPGHLYQKF